MANKYAQRESRACSKTNSFTIRMISDVQAQIWITTDNNYVGIIAIHINDNKSPGSFKCNVQDNIPKPRSYME